MMAEAEGIIRVRKKLPEDISREDVESKRKHSSITSESPAMAHCAVSC